MIFKKKKYIIKKFLNKLNYKLIDFKEKNGLLRIFIDFPYSKNNKKITIKDCEIISNQLKHILYIENIKFNFLEISSPGINRKIKNWEDFTHFINHKIFLILKNSPKGFSKDEKIFKGILLKSEKKKFKLKLKNKNNNHNKIINFTINDVYKANLITKINFSKKKII